MSLILKFTDFILGELGSDHRQELNATRVLRESRCYKIIRFLVFGELIDDHLSEFYLRLVGVSPLTAHLVYQSIHFVLLGFDSTGIGLLIHRRVGLPEPFCGFWGKLICM